MLVNFQTRLKLINSGGRLGYSLQSTNFLIRQSIFYSNLVKTKFRLAKHIITVVLLFCLTWLPYSTLVVYSQFGENVTYYITPYTCSATLLLLKLSVICSPLVFTLRGGFGFFYLIKNHRKSHDLKHRHVLMTIVVRNRRRAFTT